MLATIIASGHGVSPISSTVECSLLAYGNAPVPHPWQTLLRRSMLICPGDYIF